jgi:hypothetical protein
MFTLPLSAQVLGRATYLSGTDLAGIDDDAIPELEADRIKAHSSHKE